MHQLKSHWNVDLANGAGKSAWSLTFSGISARFWDIAMNPPYRVLLVLFFYGAFGVGLLLSGQAATMRRATSLASRTSFVFSSK